MTEKEKMLAGMLYCADRDEELQGEQTAVKELCRRYNQLSFEDKEEKDRIIRQILERRGKTSASSPHSGAITAPTLPWGTTSMSIITASCWMWPPSPSETTCSSPPTAVFTPQATP